MSLAKLTLLGTGTSNGVPVIGCDCAVCTSDDPRNARLRCAAVVESPEATVLIDCGPDFRQQALRHGLARLDHVLLTHEHADHIGGIDDLRVFNFISKQTLAISAQQYTIDAVRTRYDYCFNPKQLGGGVPQLDMRTVEPFEVLKIGGIEFLPIPYKHGILDVMGWRIGGPHGVAYLTDCSELPAASREPLRETHTVVLDALREKPHATHFNFEQAIEAARDLGAAQTYFIHMTHDVDHAKTDAALPDGINLGYDGLEISIAGST